MGPEGRSSSGRPNGREAWTSEEAVCAATLELLLPFLDDRENPRHRKLRLIGVRAEKLSR